MESIRAQVLAAGMSPALVDQLRATDIRVVDVVADLEIMARAGLEMRLAAPKLPLLTFGPNGLIRRFERRFPALTDGLVPSAPADPEAEIERLIAALSQEAQSL